MGQDQIGVINGTVIEKYDVLQVNDGEGRGWLDFSTLREPWEFDVAVRMVDNRGGINGFRKADYRITRGSDNVLYPELSGGVIMGDSFTRSGVTVFRGDEFQVNRMDGEGWVISRIIETMKDAEIAIDQTNRMSLDGDSRVTRIMTPEGKVRFARKTINAYRLSGILWQHDPMRRSETDDLSTDFYDDAAARIIETGAEWEDVKLILDELQCNLAIHDTVFSFLALVS